MTFLIFQGTAIKDAPSKKMFIVGKEFAQGGFGRIYTCKEVGFRSLGWINYVFNTKRYNIIFAL